MKELILLVGIPGAGKSTFYHQHLSGSHTHVSLDVLRSRARERSAIAALLAEGKPLVVDNTNTTVGERAGYIAAARAAGYRVRGYLFEADLRAALARNRSRAERKVPVPAVLRAWKRLERPTYAEGFDELSTVTIRNGAFCVEPVSCVA